MAFSCVPAMSVLAKCYSVGTKLRSSLSPSILDASIVMKKNTSLRSCRSGHADATQEPKICGIPEDQEGIDEEEKNVLSVDDDTQQKALLYSILT